MIRALITGDLLLPSLPFHTVILFSTEDVVRLNACKALLQHVLLGASMLFLTAEFLLGYICLIVTFRGAGLDMAPGDIAFKRCQHQDHISFIIGY